VGHALEADTVLAGDSWLARSDAPTPPSELAVLDDPRRGRAAWRFDDEGEAARVVSLLRGGGVAGGLHDRTTAATSERQPTGHGRRSSFREPVRPRMGCTFVAAGPLAPEEVVRDVRDGIYVRRMEAGSTDTRSGRAVFRVTDSDLLCDGAIDAPLRPHLLIVDGPRALPTMNRIAGDLVFDTCIGSCHREGQPLATSVGAPTFWIGLGAVCG
jgi:TldD protein